MLILPKLENHYKIEKQIGKGGMGSVYLANDKRLDRPAAIKVLELSNDSYDDEVKKEIIARFHREAKAIAKLNHSNIVGIYDIGEENNQHYMVMEFLEGKSLADILEKDKKIINPYLAIDIGIQVCNALDFAHENNIIHRDVKPANIMLSSKGKVKLTDFGIAQLTKQDDAMKLTQAGSVLGSFMYIPPEQLHNSGNVNHKADIYSLGVTLYEIATGVLPFDADSISNLFMQILSKEPNLPSSVNNEIPQSLDFVIKKALEKDPEKRYQSAQEMADDLKKITNTKNSKADFIDKDTQIINSQSNNKLSRTTQIRKTTINQKNLIFLKSNYKWLIKLVNKWKSEPVNTTNLQEIIKKVTEKALYGKSFTGSLVINNSTYLFLYDGYIIGAIDLNKGLLGDDVCSSIDNEIKSIELKIPNDESEMSIPVIISSILEKNNEATQKNLDSSIVDLVPLVNNFSNENLNGYVTCYTENNLYYYGYYQGKQIFSSSVNKLDNSISKDSAMSLEKIVQETGLILNVYENKPSLKLTSIKKLLLESEVILGYNNENKANLYDICDYDNKEVPIHLIQEVKQNTKVELKNNLPDKIDVLSKKIDLDETINDSIYMKISRWLISEYFYLLNSSGSTTSLKYIYSWIPAIEKIKFFEKLTGEDGKKYEFSLVTHGQVKGEDYKKVLCLIRVGNGSKEEIEKFIDDSISVKKKLIKSGDIGGAIYISNKQYESDSLKVFHARTVEPRKGFLGSLDKLTKYKGFVRIGFGRGFHLNLIDYNKNEFQVIAPLLK